MWVQSLALPKGLRICCGLGCRCRLDQVLPWLWYRTAAAASTRPLALELSYATGTDMKEKKGEKKNQWRKGTVYHITHQKSHANQSNWFSFFFFFGYVCGMWKLPSQIKPAPQQWPKLPQWQCYILNPLHREGTSSLN